MMNGGIQHAFNPRVAYFQEQNKKLKELVEGYELAENHKLPVVLKKEYDDLNKEFKAIGEEYDKLSKDYRKLSDDYIKARNDYIEQEKNYTKKSEEYSALAAEYKALSEERDKLEEERDEWKDEGWSGMSKEEWDSRDQALARQKEEEEKRKKKNAEQEKAIREKQNAQSDAVERAFNAPGNTKSGKQIIDDIMALEAVEKRNNR